MLGAWDTVMSRNSSDLYAYRHCNLVEVAIKNIIQNEYKIATVIKSRKGRHQVTGEPE